MLGQMKATIAAENQRQMILVLEDIEETRYLIEKMLKGNGYYVALAGNEEDAISKARSQCPNLILMSLGLEAEQLLATAQRIRQQAVISQDVPIVIFCVSTIAEGAEMEVHKNVYVTRPDNFNQLRDLFLRLLRKELASH